MTLEDMNSGISLPDSEAGLLPLNGPDGEAQSGPEVVPVSRFRARENKKAMPTNATSGPLFSSLSPSASLQFALENRLRRNLAGSGCPLYVLTWSQWDMPAGPQICRLRALARRIFAKDFSGWPTPKAGNSTGAGIYGDGEMDLQTTVQLTGPLVASDMSADTESDVTTSADSPQDVAEEAVANSPTNAQDSLENVLLSGWPTPLANKLSPQQREDFTPNLANVAQMAGWPTPNVPNGGRSLNTAERRGGTYYSPKGKKAQAHLEWVAKTVGEASNGSPVTTERRGQLNPEFSRWLMGYPVEWASCAPTGTR